MCGKRILIFSVALGSTLLIRGVGFADVIDYWRFEEGNGSNVMDQTGMANGTIRGANYWSANVPSATVPQTGQPDQHSLLLGNIFGNINQVTAVRASAITLSNFTIETFFDFNQLPNNEQYNPYDLIGWSGSAALGVSLNAFTDSGGHTIGFRFDFQPTADGGSFTDLYSQVISGPTGWNHLALVDNGGLITFYLNGLSVGSGNFNGQFSLGTNSTIYIGGAGLVPTAYMDEVRISDTALDPSQFLDAIPEPSTFALVALGVAGAAAALRRRRR